MSATEGWPALRVDIVQETVWLGIYSQPVVQKKAFGQLQYTLRLEVVLTVRPTSVVTGLTLTIIVR